MSHYKKIKFKNVIGFGWLVMVFGSLVLLFRKKRYRKSRVPKIIGVVLLIICFLPVVLSLVHINDLKMKS